MDITFLGAARTVTGSMHVVRTRESTILLECGLFQGRRKESFARNRRLPFDPRTIDVCLLSHAHIDHSGALPTMARHGFEGTIHCTPATRDLMAVMLEDAAMIQAHDARYLNRRIEREGLEAEPIEPIYDIEDVLKVLGATLPIPYRRRTQIAPDAWVTFIEAGHVLGSAIVLLDVDEDGVMTRLAFTGDLGRPGTPILRDPETPTGVHGLIMESTYGDRLHEPIERLEGSLAEVLERTFARGGKVIIPSFALERAQEVIFAIKRLRRAGRMPNVPVYVDSPLTVRVTDVFKTHPDCFDAELRSLLASGALPFEFEGLHYVADVEGSKRVTASKEPCVIISASGMCESGRVLHHLKACIGSPEHTILIVGFQAQHTLGRRLVEGRQRVRIFGVEQERRAEVVVLSGFSAHADQKGLVEFAEAVRDAGKLRRIALVHGEPKAQDQLAKELLDRKFTEVVVPEPGDVMRL